MSTAYTGTVLSDNPTGYWRLGEPSGTTAYDASGNAYHGTYAGGFTLNQASTPIKNDNNTSTLFNGTSGQVTLPGALSVAGQTAFSVEGWFRLSNITYSNGPRIIADGWTGSANKGFEIQLGNLGGNIGFYVGNGTSVSSAIWTPGGGLVAGTWYHFIGTFDNANVRLYINGVIQATTALVGPMVAGVGPFTIANLPSDIRWFPGNLDEISVYVGTALSSTQVTNHYNAAQAANFNLYQIPPYTKNRVIQPEDINQVIYTLHQPSGGQELGHYFLAGNGYVLNAVVSWYVPSLSRGSAPVSVTLDASDAANSNLNTSPPSTDHLTANGFHIFDFVNGVHTDASIGGKYTIQY